MAVKMTVKVRKRKSNSMRLPIAVRTVEIMSKRLQFFKIFWGACPQTPLGAWRRRRHAMWAFSRHKIWTPTFKILAKSLVTCSILYGTSILNSAASSNEMQSSNPSYLRF